MCSTLFVGANVGAKMRSKKLTAQYLNSNLTAGRHYDDSGTGLHIHVRKSGSKSWSQKLRFAGKQIELGLGSYPTVPLAEARRMAAENKALVAQGINPKAERKQTTITPTFSQLMDEALPSLTDGLSNEKHRVQWRSTLEEYAVPHIGRIPISEITVTDIHDLLKPIWKTKTETASRLRGRIEKVLDYGIVKKLMPPPNPATWKGNLAILLPAKSKITTERHHPALQLKDAQRWWADLKQRDGTGTTALMLLTMTTARSKEIRLMRWEELEFFNENVIKDSGYYGIWRRPVEHMKRKREHRVPITKSFYDLLNTISEKSDLVFPSKKQTPLSDMTLSALMKRMHHSDEVGYVDAQSGLPAVPHGLRSTFRDWVAETGQSREAAELQLAHKFGSAVEHAYYRTDLLELRVKLLHDWHNFLEGK